VTDPSGSAVYPSRPAERDAWIVSRRGPRHAVRPDRAYGACVEDECDADGVVRSVATLLLTNRECPFHCLMCDLWQHTLEDSVPAGAIAAQIDAALEALPPASNIKLYNSGSFFDPRAIPAGDLPEIAARLRHFRRVIVECHPAFVGDEVARFQEALDGTLEVAIGLETVHPEALERLNKRMTLDAYVRACDRLRALGVAVRAFVLVQPPFVPPSEAADWAVQTAAFAFDHGAGAVSLIPVRSGNGALDALAAQGAFSPPRLATLEDAFDRTLALGRGRVFADTWEVARFSSCDACYAPREQRLRKMNLSQRGIRRVRCARCQGA